MKKKIVTIWSLAAVCAVMLTGCGNSAGTDSTGTDSTGTTETMAGNSPSPVLTYEENSIAATESETDDSAPQTTELAVRFGDDGEPFRLYLYDNETAAAIAKHVGTGDWRLPIYHYDDYENWEVMQYYDIPSHYEIPSAPEQISEEKAGTVYYSEPNRILLFYQDAQVSAEYTPVGYFDDTDGFRKAVLDNPVLEGWGNKIVQISSGEV